MATYFALRAMFISISDTCTILCVYAREYFQWQRLFPLPRYTTSAGCFRCFFHLFSFAVGGQVATYSTGALRWWSHSLVDFSSPVSFLFVFSCHFSFFFFPLALSLSRWIDHRECFRLDNHSTEWKERRFQVIRLLQSIQCERIFFAYLCDYCDHSQLDFHMKRSQFGCETMILFIIHLILQQYDKCCSRGWQKYRINTLFNLNDLIDQVTLTWSLNSLELTSYFLYAIDFYSACPASE